MQQILLSLQSSLNLYFLLNERSNLTMFQKSIPLPTFALGLDLVLVGSLAAADTKHQNY